MINVREGMLSVGYVVWIGPIGPVMISPDPNKLVSLYKAYVLY
jgi:hypothetical protein